MARIWPISIRGRQSGLASRSGSMFDIFSALQRDMNRMLEDIPFVGRSETSAGRMIAPDIDVQESDTSLQITADLPGVKEEDIDVNLNNGFLTIKAEKREEREENEAGYHMMERSHGSFMRSLYIPFDVNEEQISAQYERGVLRITLPKAELTEEPRRRIPVKSQESKGSSMQTQASASPDAPASQPTMLPNDETQYRETKGERNGDEAKGEKSSGRSGARAKATSRSRAKK